MRHGLLLIFFPIKFFLIKVLNDIWELNLDGSDARVINPLQHQIIHSHIDFDLNKKQQKSLNSLKLMTLKLDVKLYFFAFKKYYPPQKSFETFLFYFCYYIKR